MGDILQLPYGTYTICREDKLILKGMTLESNEHTPKTEPQNYHQSKRCGYSLELPL